MVHLMQQLHISCTSALLGLPPTLLVSEFDVQQQPLTTTRPMAEIADDPFSCGLRPWQ